MFLGTHHPRLDDKGRLILPAKFRDELADGLVVAKGQDRCLVVYSAAGWEQVTEALGAGRMTDRRVRDYSRLLFASASDEMPDKQGRVTIPSGLRDYAQLTKECVVIGANTRVEIWEPAAWQAYVAEREESFSDIETEVLPGVW